jgi:hypothetical protein
LSGLAATVIGDVVVNHVARRLDGTIDVGPRERVDGPVVTTAD